MAATRVSTADPGPGVQSIAWGACALPVLGECGRHAPLHPGVYGSLLRAVCQGIIIVQNLSASQSSSRY